MACLMQLYEDWLESEPDELDSDRPTEEEMQAFEWAEKRHAKKVWKRCLNRHDDRFLLSVYVALVCYYGGAG